jgi:hypothetical protein
MIRTTDHPTDKFLFLDKDHPAMATGVLEDLHTTVTVSKRDQRLANEINRHRLARFQIPPKTNRGPIGEKHRLAFRLKSFLRHIMIVWKTTRDRDWLQNGV